MSIEVPSGAYYLGTEREADASLFLKSADLTTHGVIVGMTGSGKTGLGVVLLEEALLAGTPALIIDPKGDMGNLCLNFPDLLPTDFQPWIGADKAGDGGAQASLDAASRWKDGLASSGIEPERIRRLKDAADFSIYTPGSTAGIPLNVIGSLAAPADGADTEALQDEIEGLASSLLALVHIESDPLSSREHILLSNLIHHHWSRGKDLDIGTLIAQVQQPPMRKLGVIDLDTFFPAADRVKLAMKLNGLAASSSFASWSEGAELDVQTLLFGDGGKPRAAIIALSHLTDAERQFVVTLLMSKMVTWMRAQSGTQDLRALIYMDEVFGYVPPVGAPPTKKPILTILKQARAYGVGLVLSTQNPVDIDYKALSNAGTWMIGRLQTNRDKQRLLDGMGAADGSTNVKAIGDTLSSLDKREFVFHSTRRDAPVVFSTRWAMSYLAGPLTRQQITRLTSDTQRIASRSSGPPVNVAGSDDQAGERSTGSAAGNGNVMALADNESKVAPTIADGTQVRFVDPAAPWCDAIGASSSGQRLQAGLAVRVGLLFDDTKSKLRHESEWEAIITPLDGPIDADEALAVDFDDRDFGREAPANAVYVLPDAKIKNKGYFKSATSAIKNHLYRHQEVELFCNPELKLYSRVGESRDAFEVRCSETADAGLDADADKLRKVITKKMDRVNASIQKAEDKVREYEFDAASRKQDQRSGQALDIAGGLLGRLLGGRRSASSIITGGIRRSQSKGRMAERAAERLKTAENRYDELMDDRDDLENELSEDLLALQMEWAARTTVIEAMTVGLEKNDIRVEDAILVWIPVD